MKYASLLLLFLLASCSMSDNDGEVKPSDNIINVGNRLPMFSIYMNDGRQLTTDSLRGKPSVIVFFKTNCSDCQRELPKLNMRYLEYGLDTTFIAISREQDYRTVSDYWQEQNLSLPFSAQSDRTVYSLFANQGIPRIYVSNASCIVEKAIVVQ